MTKSLASEYDPVVEPESVDQTLRLVSLLLDTPYESWIPVVTKVLSRLDGVQHAISDAKHYPHTELSEIWKEILDSRKTLSPQEIVRRIADMSGWYMTASDNQGRWDPRKIAFSQFLKSNRQGLVLNEAPWPHEGIADWILNAWLVTAPGAVN